MILNIKQFIYKLTKIIRPGYFNRLKYDKESVQFQKLMAENNQIVYNKMYSSPELLKHYLIDSTLEFYGQTVDRIKANLSEDYEYMSCLDVGCGTGHLLAKLRESGFKGRMVGIDTAESAGEQVIRHQLSIEFFSGVLGEVELGGSFDIILCTEVLEHCDYPERIIEEMKRLLNPGGVIFITVPDGRKDTWEGHIHFWSPQSFKLFIAKICQDAKYDYFENVNMAILRFKN